MNDDWHDYVYLRGRGFDRFTGQLATLTFTEGKSDRKVVEADINIIAANQRVVIIDDEGNETIVGWAARHARQSKLQKQALKEKVNANESRKKQQSASRTDEQAGRNNEDNHNSTAEVSGDGREPTVGKQGKSSQQTDEHSGLHDQVKQYTQEELIAIADEEGIKGLRVIGDQIGVKSKTIESMIDKIVSAQSG